MIKELRPVALEDKEILRNLLEKYDYEFSQWDGRDVNKLGLYGFEYLDHYWNEPNRWAYFIIVDGALAGFAMVSDYPESDERTDFVLAEFFVMHKYRRLGVGKWAACEVFNRHRGNWQLKRHPKNLASVCFWDEVVKAYTGGSYRIVYACPNTAYDDGTLGDMLYFDNSVDAKE